MTTKFGDCMAPEGARVPHERCPGVDAFGAKCGCPHHGEGRA